MTITALEQYAIELVNRARLDPLAEARRFGFDLNAGLSPGTIDGTARQVLAPNELLAAAANRHGEWIDSTDTFSHYEGSATNSYYDPGDRMSMAGYSFVRSWSWGENIALVDVETRSAEDAITAMHRNWLFSAAHRAAMFQSDFRELGYAQVMGRYSGMDVSIGVQNFAHSGTAAFVTGVVYNDRNGDAFYSVGEGRSGIGLRIVDGDSTTSAEAGGYALGGTLGSTVTVQIGYGADRTLLRTSLADGNVKVDVANGNLLRVAGDVTLLDGSAIANVTALGRSESDLTGNGAANVLVGSGARNVLRGEGGNDVLRGGAGWDQLRGGGGADVLEGGSGNDRLNGGAGNDRLIGGGGADGFVLQTGGGADRIVDFRLVHGDWLQLDDALWSGTLTASQVVGRHADIVSGGVLFDFGGGDRLFLQDVTTLNGLAAAIDII